MDSDSKIFVAGHNGLVGSAIVRNLESNGHTNIITRTRAELDLTDTVAVNEKYFRPAEVESLLGDATKAKEKLGWEPKTSFKQLVEDMCIYGQ